MMHLPLNHWRRLASAKYTSAPLPSFHRNLHNVSVNLLAGLLQRACRYKLFSPGAPYEMDRTHRSTERSEAWPRQA